MMRKYILFFLLSSMLVINYFPVTNTFSEVQQEITIEFFIGYQLNSNIILDNIINRFNDKTLTLNPDLNQYLSGLLPLNDAIENKNTNVNKILLDRPPLPQIK